MVELLIKIAENTGKMSKDEGDTILKNLGFHTSNEAPYDPIMGGP